MNVIKLMKKYFDWTPRDIAAWEAIRAKGLLRFVTGYGLLGFGGVMFLLLGGTVFAFWLKGAIQAGEASFGFLALELAFIAALCLAGGLILSLVTWFMEEKIYQRYKNPVR